MIPILIESVTYNFSGQILEMSVCRRKKKNLFQHRNANNLT